MGIQFEDVTELPAVQRENEFREVVQLLAKNAGMIKSYVITADNAEDAQNRLAADKRKMAEAGNECTPAVTVRTPRVDTLEDGKSLKVYFTAVKKIQRKRKTDAAAAPVAAAAPAAGEKASKTAK